MKWPLVQLSDVVDVQLGKMLSAASRTNISPAKYLRNANVQWGRIDTSDLLEMDFDDDDRDRFSLRKGDLLMCEGGEPGRCAVLDRELPGVFFQKALMRLRASTEAITMSFLQRYLQYFADHGGFSDGGNQATIAHFPAIRVRSMYVPMPSLSEQHRIADILDKTDTIRRKRKEAIGLADDLLRSTFLDMFGALVRRVADEPLPKGWQRKTVDELKAPGEYTCVGGPFGSNLTSKDYTASGIPVIRGGNLGAKSNSFIDDGFAYISKEKAASLVQNMAYPGDLVFTQRGTLGQVVLVPKSARHPRYVVSQSQMKLTPNTAMINPLYLHQYFCTEWMQRHIAAHALTTGVPHINLGILRAMPVVVPPKHLQDEFARIAARAIALRERLDSSLTGADSLLGSLTHRLFASSMGS